MHVDFWALAADDLTAYFKDMHVNGRSIPKLAWATLDWMREVFFSPWDLSEPLVEAQQAGCERAGAIH